MILFAWKGMALTYYWDVDPATTLNQNGSGTWVSGGDAATANWTGTLGGANAPWVNGANNANLGATSNYTNNGVGGTITLGENITLTRIDKSGQSGAYIIEPGAGNHTITLTGSSPGFGNNNPNAAAALTVNASVLGGSLEFLKFNGGTVILAATNTWTGGTRILAVTSGSDSVLQIGNGGMTGTMGTGNVTFASAGVVSGQSVLAFNRSDTITLTQNLVSDAINPNKGILRQAGTGTLIVASENLAFTGAVQVTAGTLQIGNGATSGALATSSGVNISANATLRFDRTDAVSFSAPITGAGRILKAGSGTLTLSGSSNAFTGGTVIESGILRIGNNDALPTNTTVTFSGPGTLDLNGFDQTVGSLSVVDNLTGIVIGTESTLTVGAVNMTIGGAAAGATATLDMSALSEFVFDGPSSILSVGGNHVSDLGTATTSFGLLKLAQNNTITASAVNVSNINAGGGNHENSGTLLLGLTNSITATNLNIGGNFKNQGYVKFADGITTGSVTLRGTNAAQRMDILIGRHDSNGVEVEQSYFDSTGGTLDALVGTLTLGVTNDRSRSALGRFSMGLGTLDATTIVLGRRISSTASSIGAGASPTGTLELNGGLVLARTLIFADKMDAGTLGTVTGVFNFNSGTLRAETLRGGGGTTGVSRLLKWTAGTIETYDASTDLTISDITVTLEGSGARVFNVAADRSITVNSVINNGSVAPATAFAKQGTGTLVLGGTGSTHTGVIDIQQGELQTWADDVLSNGATIHFSGNAILNMDDNSDAISTLTVARNITATIVGEEGSLTLAGTSNWSIGYAEANSATVLDMSGLGHFTFNSSTSDINLGSQGNLANNTVTIHLAAQSNDIVAKSFGINNVVSGAVGGQNVGTVNLGLTNRIHANSVTVGNLKSNSRLQFGAAVTGGSLEIRATNGIGRATLLISKGQSGSVATNGIVDVSTGSLDALISTLIVGQNDNSVAQASNTTGSLLMGSGLLDATSIILGDLSNNSNNANYIGSGTFTLAGQGTVKVGTLTLSQRSGTGSGFSNGTFNLVAGKLQATTIQRGTAPKGSAIFNWDGGTIQNYDSQTDLTVTGVDITLSGNGQRSFTVNADRSIVVNSSLVDGASPGAQAFTKSGAGTLRLLNSSSYTGLTSVQEGVLFVGNVTGSATGVGAIEVTATGTLAGTGRLAPQGSAGLLNQGTLKAGGINSAGAGNLTLDLGGTTGGLQSVGTLSFDIFTNDGDNSGIATSADRLTLSQALATDISLSGTLYLGLGFGSSLDPENDFAENDRWLLIDWSGLSGGSPNVNFSQIVSPEIVLPTNLKWTYEFDQTGLYAVVAVVPEPNRSCLLVLSFGLCLIWRRR